MARPAGIADASPLVGHLLVGIERLLRGAEIGRHMLKVYAHARPRAKAATQRVHEHVGRLQVPAGFGVTCLPTLEACERVRFFPGSPDFDERMYRRPAA